MLQNYYLLGELSPKSFVLYDGVMIEKVNFCDLLSQKGLGIFYQVCVKRLIYSIN